MRHLSLTLLLLFSFNLCLFSQPRKVADPQLTRILFIFDCSQSMFGRWESNIKFEVARKMLLQAVDSLSKFPNVELALRMYGHQSALVPQRDCKDTKLEVPFSKNNIGALRSKINAAYPKGTTPIAYTLEQSGADFPAGNSRNIIIMITDGVEECDGDPCAISAALQKRGIILRPFVIGIGLDPNFRTTFECIGRYFDASSEATFKTAMGVIISQALNSTTAQVNLLDTYGKPSETNVPMTFYDMTSGIVRYDFVHTMNHKGNPDTLTLDPVSAYRLVVHTIPEVKKDSIFLTPGKHNVIGLDAPQGDLTLKVNGMNEYKDLQFIVRKKGDMNTLNVQSINNTTRYLVGKYDVEVLCLPRVIVKDVAITQSHTTTIQLPQPGMVNLTSNGPGYGAIMLEEKGNLKLIYNLPESISRESIVLQPGNYRAIFRSKGSKETMYTVERAFRIDSGGSVNVKLY
jgi:Ca-activated chloride channel homolog